MLGDLFPLFAAVALAVIVYVARERHRRRTQVRPAWPGITIEEAWKLWRAGVPDHPDRRFAPGAVETEDVWREVADTAAQAAQREQPRLLLREAVLHSAAMALHLDAIAALGEEERAALLKGYAPGMDALLQQGRRAYTAHWMALRYYLRLKYDDAVPEDWLHHFVDVAKPYIREKVRLRRQYLVEMDDSVCRFAEIYDKLLHELRQEMRKAPAKKRFPPADLA